MTVPTTGQSVPTARPDVRGLLIVARDQPELYDCLRHAYRDCETITVLLDRRQAERRRDVQPMLAERRHRDRRTPLSIAEDPRFQPYVLVRPHYRRPHD